MKGVVIIFGRTHKNPADVFTHLPGMALQWKGGNGPRRHSTLILGLSWSPSALNIVKAAGSLVKK